MSHFSSSPTNKPCLSSPAGLLEDSRDHQTGRFATCLIAGQSTLRECVWSGRRSRLVLPAAYLAARTAPNIVGNSLLAHDECITKYRTGKGPPESQIMADNHVKRSRFTLPGVTPERSCRCHYLIPSNHTSPILGARKRGPTKTVPRDLAGHAALTTTSKTPVQTRVKTSQQLPRPWYAGTSRGQPTFRPPIKPFERLHILIPSLDSLPTP